MMKISVACWLLLGIVTGSAFGQSESEGNLGAQGIAKPKSIAVLKFPLSARLEEVSVKDGDNVSAGDPIAKIESGVAMARVAAATAEANLTATVDEARLTWELSKKQLARLKEANARGASTSFELEEKESETLRAAAVFQREQSRLDINKMNLRLAEEELKRMVVVAPFSGEVIQVHQKVGNTVDTSMPIVTIADLSELEAELHVPVSLFGTIRVGEELKLKASSPVNREVTGKVVAVSPVIHSASRTFRCLIAIDNRDGELPAGFSVSLTEVSVSSVAVE